MSRCNTCGSKECYTCKHGKERCQCGRCEADAASEENESLRTEIAELRGKLEEVEKLYGQRVDTFIRDTEILLGRIEALERSLKEKKDG